MLVICGDCCADGSRRGPLAADLADFEGGERGIVGEQKFRGAGAAGERNRRVTALTEIAPHAAVSIAVSWTLS